jgi:cold shock CspA family protein
MSLFKTPQKRLYGVIRNFGVEGFGFVDGKDGASHFLHWRDLPSAWRKPAYRDQLIGKSVTFELARRDGRERAVNVFVIDEAHEELIGDVVDVVDVHA